MRQQFRYQFEGFSKPHNESWNATMQVAVRQFDRRSGVGPDAQPDRPRGRHLLWLVQDGGLTLLMQAET